jgi:hypothetical protein
MVETMISRLLVNSLLRETRFQIGGRLRGLTTKRTVLNLWITSRIKDKAVKNEANRRVKG